MRLGRWRVRLQAVPLCGSHLGQVVHTHTHTHVPPSPNGIIWYQSQGSSDVFGWEGNRRSDVASQTRGSRPELRETSTPPTLLTGYGTLYFFYVPKVTKCRNHRGCNWLARYDFLLVFSSDLRSRCGRCCVISGSAEPQSPTTKRTSQSSHRAAFAM